MNSKTTIIGTDDAPEYAVVPWAEYRTLIEAAEDADDRAAIAAVRADPNEERVPEDLVRKMLDGENRVRLWREHRGYKTVAALADKVGCSESLLSQIETDKRAGSIDTIRRIARVLDVDIGLLIRPIE